MSKGVVSNIGTKICTKSSGQINAFYDAGTSTLAKGGIELPIGRGQKGHSTQV
jgi:hypothetical protein